MTTDKAEMKVEEKEEAVKEKSAEAKKKDLYVCYKQSS